MARTPKLKGRPSKFTLETRKALVDAITAGLTYTHACQIVGIDYSTFTLWRNKGQEDTEGDYFDFFNALTRAETNASTAMMAHIRKAAVEDWRAAAWWLERRYPDEYGKHKIDVNHSGSVEMKTYKTFSPDEWDSDHNDSPDDQ